MKKTLSTIIIVFGALTPALAQQKKGDVELGINAGYGTANVSSFSSFGHDPKSSFNAGVIADFYFSDRWSLKTKLLFDQKGQNDGVIPSNFFNYLYVSYRLNYIILPIMANWHFGKKRNWYINFGTYFGRLTSTSTKDTNEGITDYFRKTDFGIADAIGTKIRLKDNLKLFIESETQIGLISAFKRKTGSTIANQSGSINLGLNFIY